MTGLGKIDISFKGTDLLIRNIPLESASHLLPNINFIQDSHAKGIRCSPIDFLKIYEKITENHIPIKLRFSTDYSLPCTLHPTFQLRDYQKKAMQAWQHASNRGMIILPTGAGKSHIGLFTITLIQKRTLIVVPTIELMEQWHQRICTSFKLDSNKVPLKELFGRFGGNHKNIRPITITTYNSGYLYLKKFQNYFGLLIFDEVHHLAGKKFRKIAEGTIAQARMGLTATLQESDDLYSILSKIVGPIVYQESKEVLTESGNLAEFEHRKVRVKLLPEIYKNYLDEQMIYKTYLKKFGFQSNAFQQMIFRANRDPEAKRAIIAYNRARKISFNAENKINAIQNLFSHHPKDRILLFCENIEFIEKISQYFLIPTLTSRTPTSERKKIMQHFREGHYRILASGKVLDEGIDVPEANVGIIISGTGTKRQFIQRLGRLLRPMPDKKAYLYEIITSKTSEISLASKRSRK